MKFTKKEKRMLNTMVKLFYSLLDTGAMLEFDGASDGDYVTRNDMFVLKDKLLNPGDSTAYVVYAFNPFANGTSLYFIDAHSELEAQYCAFLELYGENPKKEFDSSDFYAVPIDDAPRETSEELFERYNTSLEQMKAAYPDVDEKYNK